MEKIKIFSQSIGAVEAMIFDEKNPITAQKILKALPIESKARLWGDEVYFDIPVFEHEEDSQVEVEVGSLAYWPAGNCLCIFFGKTPASKGDLPAAASPVNVIGKVSGDVLIFKKIKNGDLIRIEAA